jgi:hypothetical protein
MTKTSGQDTGLEMTLPVATTSRVRAERAFSVSMLISAIRCTLTYVVFPFALPLLGLAPGVGPVLGVTIGVIAIAANVFSIRRFWRARHPWRRPITALHIGVIGLLLVLIVIDLSALVR